MRVVSYVYSGVSWIPLTVEYLIPRRHVLDAGTTGLGVIFFERDLKTRQRETHTYHIVDKIQVVYDKVLLVEPTAV